MAGICVYAVSEVLADCVDDYIKFRTTNAELEEVQNGFFLVLQVIEYNCHSNRNFRY